MPVPDARWYFVFPYCCCSLVSRVHDVPLVLPAVSSGRAVETCAAICAKYMYPMFNLRHLADNYCGNLHLRVLTVHARRCVIEQVSMTSEWVFNSSCYILVKVSNLCTILPRSHAYERAARVFCKISTRLQPYVIGSACALELT